MDQTRYAMSVHDGGDRTVVARGVIVHDDPESSARVPDTLREIAQRFADQRAERIIYDGATFYDAKYVGSVYGDVDPASRHAFTVVTPPAVKPRVAGLGPR